MILKQLSGYQSLIGLLASELHNNVEWCLSSRLTKPIPRHTTYSSVVHWGIIVLCICMFMFCYDACMQDACIYKVHLLYVVEFSILLILSALNFILSLSGHCDANCHMWYMRLAHLPIARLEGFNVGYRFLDWSDQWFLIYWVCQLPLIETS